MYPLFGYISIYRGVYHNSFFMAAPAPYPFSPYAKCDAYDGEMRISRLEDRLALADAELKQYDTRHAVGHCTSGDQ